MWGDFPQDAQEAFADAQEDVDRKNYFLDRIIEETMVKVRGSEFWKLKLFKF